MRVEKCDIIICGAGLAGMSLLYRAMKSGLWKEQSVIVIDSAVGAKEERIWSFWKRGETYFDELIFKDWHHLVFYNNKVQRKELKTGDYTYNSISSIDFFSHISAYLHTLPNITFITSAIEEVINEQQYCRVITPEAAYSSTYVFNSIYKKPELRGGDYYFLQHFKGWRIQCSYNKPVLDEAYLMDFRASQLHGTTFFYTLPLAEDELFVEYTLFSEAVLPDKDYTTHLNAYITRVLGIKTYEILKEEFGVIPMTNHQFKRFDGNIIHIGTAGGDTRASTGYTFTNLQKTVTKILDSWQSTGTPFFKKETLALKQSLYDATLLGVLSRRKYHGHQLFGDLFKKTPAPIIFKFLDAETSFWEDLMVMKSLRIFPFLKAFVVAVFWKIFSKK